jgi:GTPase SAR1 family protein
VSTVVFVILVGLIVAAVTQVVRRRRRLATGKTALDDAKTQEAAIPAFRIVALGPRGSGKTLLLSSMYHEMRLPR